MTATAERPVSKTRQELVTESQRLEEDVLYSTKGHYEATRLWSRYHWLVGLPLVILSALAAWSPPGNVDPDGSLRGWIALAILLLSALATFVNAQDRVAAHKAAGGSYDTLRGQLRMFRSIDCNSDAPDEVLTERLKAFAEHKARLNETCPGIPRLAFVLARKRITDGEAEYAIDKKPKD